MMKSFSSPSLYIQGQDILLNHCDQMKRLGKRAVILSNGVAIDIAANPLSDKLNEQHLFSEVLTISDDFDDYALSCLCQKIHHSNADIVIAVGGGKVIDTAKIIAAQVECRLVVIPTLASTDAPTSRLSAKYNRQGNFERYIFFDDSPALVMVDTSIIVNAPTRTLIAGIADALATFIEYRAVQCGSGHNMFGDRQTITAGVLAEQASKTIFQNAELAIEANNAHVVDNYFEAVVEANILMSGLGFESGGEAAAHSIANGLTTFISPAIMHGEKVAFGLLGQLILSKSSDITYKKYLDFQRLLGLPVCLKDLGIMNDQNILRQIAREILRPHETIHQMNLSFTEEDIVNMLLQIDSYAKK
ncbi:glycerol dehydrogenase [Leuconostoc gasicomitatum]|uniref:glycerol dehydrogenase n=1 Tax=Leuconostoc gasicomitatum TaxID=115778 RepID=UPI000B7E9A7E|nr:glycerol dehydrogenase [Leuconostoc gasicomitatum]